jgi:uncharacterized membrane protein YbhN (UPF0104 family)
VSKRWRVLGSLILVAVLAWRVDWSQVGSAFAHLNASLWLLAVGLYALTQIVSSIRWQLLAQALGFGGSWRQYLAYYYIGMFFNLLLPTSVGGDVVRTWYLSNLDGPSPPAGRGVGAFLSVFADRANGLFVLILLACLATLGCPLALPGWITGTVAGLGGISMLALALFPLLPRLRPALQKRPRLSRLAEGAGLYLGHPGVLIWATVLSLVVQVANVVLVWLIGRALGLPVPAQYYGVLVPLVSVLTLLPISLNGMGLREAGTVLLLAPLGVSAASAVTLSLLTFAVFTVTSLGGVAFYLFGQQPQIPMQNAECRMQNSNTECRTEINRVNKRAA